MSEPLSVTEVPNTGWDDRVRAFRSGATVDSFAIIAQRFLILVDTLDSMAAIRALMHLIAPEILRRPDRPLLVINTHADWDHVWGNGLFSGPSKLYPAPIIGHHAGAARMSSPEARTFLRAMQRQHPGRYDDVRWTSPDLCLHGRVDVDGGDVLIEILPTPGHTPDHLSLWLPGIRLLLAGDAVEWPVPSVENTASVPVLRDSLQRLADLEPVTVLCCHAGNQSDPGLIAENIAYFDELELRARAAIAHSCDPPRRASDGMDWPLANAVQLDSLAPAQRSFYETVHEQNVRAMIGWLTATKSPSPGR